MVPYMSKLNKSQEQAVRHVGGPLRVIAGAGTGKTRVLTTRMVYLVDQIGIKPSRILCITFTNKAAEEMRVRVKTMLGDFANVSYIMTYHAFCQRVLREHIHLLGWQKNFTVMDREDQESLIKQIYREHNFDKEKTSVKAAIAYISSCKSSFVSPQQALAMDGRSFANAMKAKVYEQYANRQRRLNLLDFDDLIILVCELFANHPEALDIWQKRFDYVMVDEFQDTNDSQYQLTKALCEKHHQLFVVGDPDQTIYTWRGSNINLILRLDDDFPELETILLEENYRSTRHILEQSNALITKNKERIDKTLYTNNPPGERVDRFEGMSPADESQWVVNKIADLIAEGVARSEIAVLYRSNFLSREVEQKMIQKGVSYAIYGGTHFFNRKEIKDMLAYMKAALNGDELSLRRIINVPSRKISEETVTRLAAYAEEKKITLAQAIKDADNTPLPPAARNAVIRFDQMMDKIKASLKEDYPDFLEAIMELTEYKRTFDDSELTTREDNIKELMNSLFEFQQNNPDGSLEDYLNEVALYTSQDKLTTVDTVSLMTVHAAKGLEFEHVFIVGMIENVFPSKNALEVGDNAIEEERRIAYVAITRAKKRLYLTNPLGFSYVTKAPNVPSRFFYDLRVEDLHNVVREFKAIATPGEAFYSAGQAINIAEQYVQQDRGFSVGETIVHTAFGTGIIINVFGDMIEVAFKHPFGVKTLMSKHKAIVRKLS